MKTYKNVLSYIYIHTYTQSFFSSSRLLCIQSSPPFRAFLSCPPSAESPLHIGSVSFPSGCPWPWQLCACCYLTHFTVLCSQGSSFLSLCRWWIHQSRAVRSCSILTYIRVCRRLEDWPESQKILTALSLLRGGAQWSLTAVLDKPAGLLPV